MKNSGQSLIELIIGMAIGALMIGVATSIIVMTLRVSSQNKNLQNASFSSQEQLDNVMAMAEGNWHKIYNLSPKGTETSYRLNVAGAGFEVASGSENIQLEADGIVFARYFTVENVSRDATTKNIESNYNPDNEDPSVQKITSYVSWSRGGSAQSVNLVQYLVRTRNLIFRQTDWGAGPDQEGPITFINNKFASSTNINYTGAPGTIKLQGY